MMKMKGKRCDIDFIWNKTKTKTKVMLKLKWVVQVKYKLLACHNLRSQSYIPFYLDGFMGFWVRISVHEWVNRIHKNYIRWWYFFSPFSWFGLVLSASILSGISTNSLKLARWTYCVGCRAHNTHTMPLNIRREKGSFH